VDDDIFSQIARASKTISGSADIMGLNIGQKLLHNRYLQVNSDHPSINPS
jgi:hypothetical protein